MNDFALQHVREMRLVGHSDSETANTTTLEEGLPPAVEHETTDAVLNHLKSLLASRIPGSEALELQLNQDGQVTMRGHLAKCYYVQRAIQTALTIDAVGSVRNEIEVALAPAQAAPGSSANAQAGTINLTPTTGETSAPPSTEAHISEIFFG